MYEEYATGLRYGPTASFCKHGTEHYDLIYAGTFLDKLIHNCSKKKSIIDLDVLYGRHWLYYLIDWLIVGLLVN
jgi:hypothetical protein